MTSSAPPGTGSAPGSDDAPAPVPYRVPRDVPLLSIFLTFLFIGAISFGGGVVAYLRSSLVLQRRWLDEEHFLSALGIAQALPGLNATNMSIIVGDRLRGVAGAIVAFTGMTLPGGTMVLVLGVLYAANAHNPYVNATLVGVGAAAVGMLSAVTLQIGRRQLGEIVNVSIIAVTVLMVSFLHISLVWVLLTVGPAAVFLFRPRKDDGKGGDKASGDKGSAGKPAKPGTGGAP